MGQPRLAPLRELLRAYFEQESISVVEAGTGEEALATIAQAPPSLVLLDGRLPRYRRLRRHPRLDARRDSVPVIIVTSLEDELDQLVGYRMGAVDYVVKPCPGAYFASDEDQRGRRQECHRERDVDDSRAARIAQERRERGTGEQPDHVDQDDHPAEHDDLGRRV